MVSPERESRHDDPHRPEGKEERRRRREEKRQRKEERRRRREARERVPSPSPKRQRAQDSISTGDSFVWKKKIEQDRKRGVEHDGNDERCRREELQRELADAKRRREQRDRERAEWEAEQMAAAREREAAENAGWHMQEASFHGSQHFLRQGIRIREGRASGTDVLARYVRLDLGGEADVLDLDAAFEGLGISELEKLVNGIEEELDFVVDLTTKADNEVWNRQVRLEFWDCVSKCAKERLQTLRSKEAYGEADGVHSAVDGEVEALLRGKPLTKLREMEHEIVAKLEDGGSGFAEVDFWTAALARIRSTIAAQRVREITAILAEERRERELRRPKVEDEERRPREEVATEDDMMKSEAAKGMGSDEENFADEVEAPDDSRRRPTAGYAWNDKYRPRKPRYFNRVHTGYNWTKYNRTHYDHDNPPPKTVQGYKFNIFYPDLIDPSKTPTYSVTKTDNPEVAIITFKAGPPYEDLAFKIVNRPWERSHRRGFRCSFDRGILHLWFHLQRYRYRR